MALLLLRPKWNKVYETQKIMAANSRGENDLFAKKITKNTMKPKKEKNDTKTNNQSVSGFIRD